MAHATGMALPARHTGAFARSVGRLALLVTVLGLSAMAVTAAYRWSEGKEYARLNYTLSHQLDLYSASLESELGKHEYLPGIIALEPDVQALLAQPLNEHLAEKANKRLTSLNVRAGALSVYVLDRAGVVRAASNWYLPESLVGKDLSGLPYVADARKGVQVHAFARSAVRDSPEYYFAQPVRHRGAVVGVAVVKISLDPIESTWIAAGSQSNQEIFLVLDENDNVILASSPDWRDKKAAALGALLAKPGAAAPKRPVYASQSKAMVRQGWRLVTLTSAAGVAASAWQSAFGAAVLSAFLTLLGLFLIQRRRAIVSRQRAREALQKAHDELEQRIALRTIELYDTNQELMREIGERKHAEQVLRASQDELVHASKLALLGQMSAGITHEISQPLTALRSLSFNTRLLLKRGDLERSEKNLQSIGDLCERMGRLTGQLKSFSRKTPLTLEPCLLTKAVDNSLLLLENRIRTEHIDLKVDADGAEQLRALCDGHRLEQVLINLCANAIDAMHAAPQKRLTVRVWRSGAQAFIRVGDSGTGIQADTLARLFEPFYSTKPPGEGLGLGLAISSDIVREFGGTLRGFNIDGGAAFEIALPLIEEHHHV